MRRRGVLLGTLAICVVACGGDDGLGDLGDQLVSGDDVSAAAEDGDSGGDDGVNVGQDPDFDTDSLPDDFPSELLPPDWDTGMYSEALGLPTATFESTMAFDDIVIHYNTVHGENIIVGDPGEQLAQWTRNPPWVVSVFDGDPMLVGITRVPDE